MIDLETERPPVAVTTEGQPSVVETYGNASFAHREADASRDAVAWSHPTLDRNGRRKMASGCEPRSDNWRSPS